MKKYILTVGLNDQDTKKQKHFKKWYYKKIYQMLDNIGIDGATLTESRGYYTHDNGKRVVEKSINIELLFVDAEKVNNLSQQLLKKFNQESIVVSTLEINSNLIYKKEITEK